MGQPGRDRRWESSDDGLSVILAESFPWAVDGIRPAVWQVEIILVRAHLNV